ncbi:Mu transposase C-terminal domain-containing protein [Fluviicola taffensis]|uniref:Mu transposase C-terminal domain-containing protein n=1 Tax=Fluviicola taffensis TaxID=191579 RepID=UPI003137E26E
METIKFDIGDTCILNEIKFVIDKFITPEKVIIRSQETNEIQMAYTRTLSKIDSDQKDSMTILDLVTDDEWREAQRRFSIILEIETELQNNPNLFISDAIDNVALKHKISSRTIYRWKKRFDNSSLISSLVPGTSSGGRGVGRISNAQEIIIKEVINEFHFNSLKPRVKKSYRELSIRCRKNNIVLPSLNTFRSRISRESLKKSITKRHGRAAAHQITEAVTGHYPKVHSPLEVLQIDHTPLDIIVVSEDRKPIGRPWLTLAIDLYSRMIAGFYISFDTPGTLGTGICISNAILPKDPFISKYNLKSEWPLNGKIQNVHSDNAPEFKSKSLLIACQEYGIHLNYRGKGKTHWGGHIERLLGNFLEEVHLIPGTTFSNTKDRGDYDSTGQAVLTIKELDNWLHVFIVDVYHNNIHTALGMSPLKKYYEGVNSLDSKLPSGMGSFNFDPLKVKIDFLPAEVRTVQRTGVQIDHIRYFADVLKPYVYIDNPSNSLSVSKRKTPLKLIFKRDPRDISRIYFLEPKLKKYFPIYYADASRPPINIWEHREALKELKRKGKIDKITEDIIFEAHDELKKIVDHAKSEKRKALREERKKSSEEHIPSQAKSVSINSSINSPGPDFDNIDFFTFNDEL